MKDKKVNIKYIFITLLILLFAYFPFAGINSYYFHLIAYSLIWVIMTQGLNIIQGYTGYVSITQAAFFGIGAYGSAILSIKLGISVWLSIPLAVIITMLFGMIIGFLSLRTKGHYFAIVTMSFGMIVWVLLVAWKSFTGGEAGMAKIPAPSPILGIDFSINEFYYYLILIGALLSIFVSYCIVHSKIGRSLITIRENEQLSIAVGIQTKKYKLFAFTMSAILGGLSGALYAHYANFINPSTFTIDYSLNAILAVILGGSGTITGPILGSFLLIFIPEYLRIAEDYRLIIYGVLLILITIYMPKGLVYLLTSFWDRLRDRVRSKKYKEMKISKSKEVSRNDIK